MASALPMVAAALMSGVGMVMQNNAAESAQKKQQAIINQGQEEQARLSKQKSNTIENYAADTFDVTNRNNIYEDSATKNEGSLADALTKANADSGNTGVKSSTDGNLSADYLRSRGEATSKSVADIANRTRLMARANANSLLGASDASATNNLNSDLAGITGASTRSNGYTNTKLGAVRNNGSLIGGLLTGLAPIAGMGVGNYQASGNVFKSSPTFAYNPVDNGRN